MNSTVPIQRSNNSTIQRLLRSHVLRFTFYFVLFLTTAFEPEKTFAATIVGDLKDISVQALNTKMMFSPTTNVLLTASGLSAGPPRIIDTTSGAFTIDLEAGDYTVSLPLVTWRAPFKISVFSTNGTVNITNLLSPPTTYTYTNYLATGPVHVNTAAVTVWSTNGSTTLLDSATTLPAGVLAARNVLIIEAFGSSSDPGANLPTIVFTLKLGSTTILSQSKASTGGSWHLQALATIRAPGSSGSVVASLAAIQESAGSPDLFPLSSTVTTVNTTTPLAVDLKASIDDYTGTEKITCDQLLIRLL